MIAACERTTPREQLRRNLAPTDGLDGLLAPLLDRGYLTEDADGVSPASAGEHAVAAQWTVQDDVESRLFAGFTEQERGRSATCLGGSRTTRSASVSTPRGEALTRWCPTGGDAGGTRGGNAHGRQVIRRAAATAGAGQARVP